MTEDKERPTALSSVAARGNTNTQNTDDEEYASVSSGLVRLLWVFLGPMGLIAYCFLLAQRDPLLHSPISLGFWGAVAGVVFLRYIDVRVFGGATAEGKPSTMADVQRFAAVVGGFSGAGWVIAHMI